MPSLHLSLFMPSTTPIPPTTSRFSYRLAFIALLAVVVSYFLQPFFSTLSIATLLNLEARDTTMSSPTRFLNVFREPLKFFSPSKGYYRDGFCRVTEDDAGEHAIAAVVTDEFLDFTALRGNDLRPAGVTANCRWCLCVTRWKEAFDARTDLNDKRVPKVVLAATDQKALGKITLENLKMFAYEDEQSTSTSSPASS